MSFKNEINHKNIVIKSIVISYILKTSYILLYNKSHIVIDNIMILTVLAVIVSAILGLLVGKLKTSNIFNIFLHISKIGRTANDNIWDDVIKPKTWLRIFMKDGSSYLGQYRYGEPFKSEPIIVIATYQKLDEKSNIKIDNSQNKNEFMMINTKDFDRIEITYTDKENYIFLKKINILIDKFKNKLKRNKKLL